MRKAYKLFVKGNNKLRSFIKQSSLILRIYIRLHDIWKRMTGKAQHSSNADYKIQHKVYELLSAGDLTSDKILKVDNKQQQEILDDVCKMANKRKTGEFADKSQIDETRDFISDNMSFMTSEFLDRIEQIAMSSGLFVLAYAVREKNEEFVIEQADIKGFLTKRNAVKLFWCYVKRGYDDKARSLLESSAIKRTPHVYFVIRELCMALGLLPRDFSEVEKKTENKAFADYVRDKRIAIIGPSSSGTDNSEEIKRDFDIIIRITYRGIENLPEAEHELVPQISYYNKRVCGLLFTDSNVNCDFLKDLDFVVLKQHNRQIYHKVSQFTNVRFAISCRPKFFFLGHTNMVPAILEDLSSYRPFCVKIFNANLFLSDNLYSKKYITLNHSLFDGNRIRLWRSFSIHNIISQYDYVRQLYLRELIEADTRLSEILNLGTAEYMNQLEKQENVTTLSK